MYIVSYFEENSEPKTGLTPTIKIRDVSSTNLLVNNASMIEVGDGFYKYDFTSYDSTKDYAALADGGISLNNSDRYKYAGNENYIEDISTLTSGLATSAALANVQSDLNNPDQFKADVSGLATSVALSAMNMQVLRILGLLDENSYLDQQTYDTNGNLTSARKRIYTSSGMTGTDNDVMDTYNITATWSGQELTSYKMIKV